LSRATDKRTTPWRDNLEAITFAVIMAVVLKHFIVEAYKIPTGSMQPTLMGNEETGIFDRILVDKLSYHYRAPKRFEVAVFQYPLDLSKNFVKRVVGIGPEELRIAHGDLWRRDDASEPWSILRRPRPVVREMLKALDLGPPPEGRASRWVAAGGGALDWTFEGRTIRADGPGRARFRHDRHGLGSIMDSYRDGYPPGMADDVVWTKPAGMNEVGDLRVEADVRAHPDLTEVAFDLSEGGRTYRFVVPGPGRASDVHPHVLFLGPNRGGDAGPRRAEAEHAFRLSQDAATRLAAMNLDDRLTLEIDDEVVLELDVDPAPGEPSRVELQLTGGGADLDDLQVQRDVYYTTDRATRSEYTIPDGHYFMLGDNTQDSSDGREWRFLRMSWPATGGEIVRGGYRYQENPRTRPTIDGRITFFEDEFGERHEIPAGTERKHGYEDAPFVAEHLITGRALLVFWPWSPQRDLLRWHWVH